MNDAPSATPASHGAQTALKIVVTGDVFVEYYFWQGVEEPGRVRLPYTWPDDLRSSSPTDWFSEISGAPLHKKIIEAFLATSKVAAGRVQVTGFPEGDLNRDSTPGADAAPDDEYPVYMHRLGPFPISDVPPSDERVWRITQSFGSVHRRTANADKITAKAGDWAKRMVAETMQWLKTTSTSTTPTVVVVNDRDAAGSRKDPFYSTREILRKASNELGSSFKVSQDQSNGLLVLWHVRDPIFEGNPIFEFFDQFKLCRNTIPIINHNCLRDQGVSLRFDMSYESTIRKFIEALHGPLRVLLEFPHVLIRFDYGILHLSTNSVDRSICLDIHGLNAGPYRMNSQQFGMITGTTPLLLCAILQECAEAVVKGESLEKFLRPGAAPNSETLHAKTRLDRALDAALLLAGLHYHSGFGPYTPLKRLALSEDEGTLTVYRTLFEQFRKVAWFGEGEDYSLRFKHQFESTDRLMRLSVGSDVTSRSATGTIARAAFSRTEAIDHNEVLARSSPLSRDSQAGGGPVRELGVARIDRVFQAIVTCGVEQVLTDENTDSEERTQEPSVLVPFVKMGRYVTLDWREIDAFLALRQLVDKYVAQADFREPWPIAVFGPPGSGKGTVVREALSHIPDCVFDETLVCNLSQIKSSDGLAKYFHRIQDRSSKGVIPIAFFDEFDCPRDGQPVGWLSSFLMPLQDGLYMEGEETFNVGKVIFVFAGGIAHTYESFCSKFLSMTDQKVPDFVSRLRGFVNVLDISQSGCEANAGARPTTQGAPDAQLRVRRAVILRSILTRRMPQIVDVHSGIIRVHPGIIDAFLNVRRYLHGVRSMEAIVQMSRVAVNAQSFQPSALPHDTQLRMHVDDVDQFLQLVAGRTRIQGGTR